MAMKKIRLKTSDLEIFEVEESPAVMSGTFKNMIDDGCADDVIPVLNVTSEILCKVLEYCKNHKEDGSTAPSEKLKKWDREFMKQVDLNTLYDLILAANYLEIRGLLDLTCQTVADMFKGKTVEEIRQTLNVKNDLTSEEEAEIRKEYEWAFE